MSIKTPFPRDEQLTAIAIAVTNNELIADQVIPRGKPLTKKKFTYTQYETEQFFAVPETAVSRKGRMNQVEFGGEEKHDEVLDYGLEAVIPVDDIEQTETNIEGITVEATTNIVLLDREIRTANLIMDATNYGSNVEFLSGTDMWDNPASDPLTQLLTWLEIPLMRPNQLTFGTRTWMTLRTHPVIVSAVLGNSGTRGAVSVAAVAELLGVSKILVGKSRMAYQPSGQPSSLKHCWKEGAVAMSYMNQNAVDTAGIQGLGNPTFAFTAQYGKREVRAGFDGNVGARGAKVFKVFESVKEIICASDMGFLAQNVIAP